MLSVFIVSPNVSLAKQKRFEKYIHPGIKYIYLVNSEYPIEIRVLEIDLYNFSLEVKPAIAWDRVGRLERLSSLASRYRAMAGINGGFFNKIGEKNYPVGYIMINQELIFKSDIHRTSFGITVLRDTIFGYFKPYLRVRIKGNKYSFLIQGINRPRPKDGVILYTPHFGKRTGTDFKGQEIVIRKTGGRGKIVDIVDGNAKIPPDGYVLSFAGKSLRLIEWLYIGAEIHIEESYPQEWSDVVHLITGGPRLVKNSQIVISTKKEGFRGYLLGANPRTAIGVTKNNKLLMVVVDGRNPKKSIGFTFRQLAKLMLDLGATDAMGLDSGGSSAMYVKGRIVNSPSDGKERAVANGLLVLKQ